MRLSIYGPINTLSYGNVTTNLTASLAKLGHDVQLYPINPQTIECESHHREIIGKCLDSNRAFLNNVPAIKIWHQWEHSIFPANNLRVGFPIFELDSLTELERHNLCSLDKIFVCSNWAKEVIHNNGCVTADVVPLGVDLDIFSPSSNSVKNKTIFLNIGKWEFRKGHVELVQAFNKAFDKNDKVELWMMSDNCFLQPDAKAWWENLYKSYELSSKIRLLPRLNSQNEVKYIIGQSHFGVFPSRAEGWGLGTLEMMACGVPSIVSNYSGHTQFCNQKNSLLINFDGVEPASDNVWFKPGGLVNDGNWGKFTESTMEQLISCLREAHQMNMEQSQKLKGLKEECLKTASQFTWEASAKLSPSSFGLRVAEKIAVVTLGKHARGKLKPCRDTIDFIMSYIVRGATTFNPNKGTEFQTYLITKARFAIKHLLKKKSKKKKGIKIFSLDKPLASNGYRDVFGKDLIADKASSVETKYDTKEILDYIRYTPYFVERQKRILLGIFEDNQSLADLAEELDIHRSYAYMLFDQGLEKLRWKFNEGK